MDRRRLLKAAGVGSAGLALPGIMSAVPVAAQAADDADVTAGNRGQLGMRFMAQSAAGVDADGVDHRIAMGGEGFVTPGHVVAHGSYVHFDNAEALPPPKPVLSTGTWKSRRLRSFHEDDGWGVFLAGTVELDIDLIPVEGGRIPALFTLNCNLPPAGIFTPGGLPEGFFLEFGGLSFEPFGLGLTIFVRGSETPRA
jgi:hypothetical protein